MSEDIFKSAVVHHSKKNFLKAKELYENLLKTNPENLAILQNYASLLSQTKEHKKGIQLFDPYFPYAKSIFDELGVAPEDYPQKRDD